MKMKMYVEEKKHNAQVKTPSWRSFYFLEKKSCSNKVGYCLLDIINAFCCHLNRDTNEEVNKMCVSGIKR
jgi:hypothetical protein